MGLGCGAVRCGGMGCGGMGWGRARPTGASGVGAGGESKPKYHKGLVSTEEEDGHEDSKSIVKPFLAPP